MSLDLIVYNLWISWDREEGAGFHSVKYEFLYCTVQVWMSFSYIFNSVLLYVCIGGSEALWQRGEAPQGNQRARELSQVLPRLAAMNLHVTNLTH